MARPTKLDAVVVDSWLGAHPGWARERDGLARTYSFPDFSAALGFVVRVGLVAEKRDHHPDVTLSWGKASVFWTTHDAGGISQLDLDLAAASDSLAG
ncbi:MAG: 4a-hydroxytetrahydrobiopterin dehydratase [Labilithrix sp.]|nr:4a-hydroxytetrahydrobiopterin dehydratase [Labilithrix sp.]MCW5811739.1 4a-hydroxytetrahydrobiopterin dehydratase [Labilithrix sp.]